LTLLRSPYQPRFAICSASEALPEYYGFSSGTVHAPKTLLRRFFPSKHPQKKALRFAAARLPAAEHALLQPIALRLLTSYKYL
jgi:hypothetical protein